MLSLLLLQGGGDVATFTARCQASLENCTPLVVPRGLPLAPTVEVSLQGTGPLFTHNTLSLYFDTALTEQVVLGPCPPLALGAASPVPPPPHTHTLFVHRAPS